MFPCASVFAGGTYKYRQNLNLHCWFGDLKVLNCLVKTCFFTWSGFWWMKRRLECTQTWSTRVFLIRKTNPWVCTVLYGMLTIGPPRVVVWRRIGATHPSLPPSRTLRSMLVNALCQWLQWITLNAVAAVRVRSIGGMSQIWLNSTCTRAISWSGLGPDTSSMTIALTLLGSQSRQLSVFITVTTEIIDWKIDMLYFAMIKWSHDENSIVGDKRQNGVE